MNTYQVTGHIAIFGSNMVLKLSENQAQTRINSLKKKKKDTYVVLDPIQFKQGEEITIVSGNVSKSLLKDLLDLSSNSEKKDSGNKDEDANKNKPSKDQKNEKSNNKTDDKIINDKNDVNNLPNV